MQPETTNTKKPSLMTIFLAGAATLGIAAFAFANRDRIKDAIGNVIAGEAA